MSEKEIYAVVNIDKKKIHKARKTIGGHYTADCGQDIISKGWGLPPGVFLVSEDDEKVTCHKCKYGVGR
jgi:prolyl-tRNA synthetase